MVKPQGCVGCPLEHTGQGFCPDEHRANPKLLIQLEAPGHDEIDEGMPTVGKAGRWLWQNIMQQAGVTRDECAIGNTLRCLPPMTTGGEYYPTGKIKLEAETHCRQYDQWEQYDKSIPLLLLGNHAMMLRVGVDSIQKWRGHVDWINGRLTGMTFHPAAVMRMPNLLPVVIADVENLLKASSVPDALKRPVIHICE